MYNLNSGAAGQDEKRDAMPEEERQRKEGGREPHGENGGASCKCGEDGASTSREMWDV